ncbi:hypothetical protein QTP88_016528 [Uroleucon formosanum]
MLEEPGVESYIINNTCFEKFLRPKKQIQLDETFIFDVEDKRDNVLHIISKMRESPHVGGWKDTTVNTISDVSYISNYENNTTTYMLKGFQPFDYVSNSRRKIKNQFVTDNTSFAAIRNDIIEPITNYMLKKLLNQLV